MYVHGMYPVGLSDVATNQDTCSYVYSIHIRMYRRTYVVYITDKLFIMYEPMISGNRLMVFAYLFSRYVYCLKCFIEIPGDTVSPGDDPSTSA